MTNAPPRDAVTAVTHPNPYPYYADLVARRPLFRDDRIGMWVAASAGAVTAVLDDPSCRVRPSAEPVPKALLGSPAGAVFAALVRMNDGAAHCPMKRAVSAALGALDRGEVAAEAARLAGALVRECSLGTFIFRLPVHVVATLLGAPGSRLGEVTDGVDAFVRGIAPGADAEAVEAASRAVSGLLDLFDARRAGLADALDAEAKRAGIDRPDAVLANAVGFLSQTYEATAGLIGNTIVTLMRDPALRQMATHDPGLLPGIVAEVARHDPPVQNTRRFVAADALVAGQPMKAGDAILVVLAAANRDPAANPEPARFDPSRTNRRTFTFGLGRHACPGETIAATIAAVGLRAWMSVATAPLPDVSGIAYRPSANTRIPLLG